MDNSSHLQDARTWDRRAAEAYDTPGEGMFRPELVNRTVDVLQALAGDGSALEFAIGTGRIGVPLLSAGVPVQGIELSADMLAVLRRKVSEAELPVAKGDMSQIRVPGEFKLVYLLYNTITNILTQEAQTNVFRNAARHLTSGGYFLVEVEEPDLRGLSPGRSGTFFTVEPTYIGFDLYEPEPQHLVSHHLRFDEDGSNVTLARSRHRYVWQAEMDLMARIAGLKLHSRWLDWDKQPPDSDHRGSISVYVKP